jgi:hypothetical protein
VFAFSFEGKRLFFGKSKFYVTSERGDSKIAKKRVTYYLNGPLNNLFNILRVKKVADGNNFFFF